jgi:hypothetical protein
MVATQQERGHGSHSMFDDDPGNRSRRSLRNRAGRMGAAVAVAAAAVMTPIYLHSRFQEEAVFKAEAKGIKDTMGTETMVPGDLHFKKMDTKTFVINGIRYRTDVEAILRDSRNATSTDEIGFYVTDPLTSTPGLEHPTIDPVTGKADYTPATPILTGAEEAAFIQAYNQANATQLHD